MPATAPRGRARRNVTGLLLLALCFTLALVSRGLVESFTTFVLPLSQEFGWSRTSLNSIFAIYALTAGFAAPGVGWMLDRFGAGLLYLSGMVLLAASFLAASQSEALWHLQLSIGVGVGIAYVALGSIPHTVVLSEWFPGKLSSAMGIVQSANGLGVFLIVPLAQFLSEIYGWRMSYAALATLCVVPLLPVLLLRRALKTTPVGQADMVVADIPPETLEGVKPAMPSGWTFRRAVREVYFWNLICIFVFTSLGNFLITPQIVPLFVSVGIGSLEAAGIFGVIGMLAMIGGIGYGWLTDRIGVLRAAAISFTQSILGVAVLIAMLFVEGQALAWLFAVLFGPAMGARFAMVAKSTAALYGGPQFGRIFGAICFGIGTGTAAGSMAGGLIHDMTNGYVWVAIASMASMVLAFAPFLVIHMEVGRRSAQRLHK